VSGGSTGVYKWGSKKGYNFSFGLHTMVFQAEIDDIKACRMQNLEAGYTRASISSLEVK
jgi:hypothetical protein